MINLFLRFSWLFIFCVVFPAIAVANEQMPPPCTGFWCEWKNNVSDDYENYYSKENLWWLGGGLAVAGVMANTSIDQDLSNEYQNHLRSNDTNDFAATVKPIGDPLFVLTYVGGYSLGYVFQQSSLGSPLTEWSKRSMRALLVGLPPMWALQWTLGSYRPSQNENSYWHPFNEDHGVSGHAFMGAIPFLTAAEMVHQPIVKGALYIASTFTGLSRINDNQHYPSQVFLGWWLAYLAVDSVDYAAETHLVHVTPAMVPGGGAVNVSVDL